MGNISKNLLLGLTLVCVVVLIVFCIQLIVLNRGVDPVGTGSVISGGGQDDGNSDTENGDEDTEDDTPQVNAPSTPRPPPQGTRHQFRVSESNMLIVYAREELFDFEERDFDWWFLYTGGGIATLEIKHTMIGPQGIEAHAEAFLNSYASGAEAEYAGEGLIAGSELRGHHVTTRHGNEIYEAWIHILLDSDLALVFVICYENDQQKDALYEVLSTLLMEAVQLPAAGGADTPTDADTGDTDAAEPEEPEEPANDEQGERPTVS